LALWLFKEEPGEYTYASLERDKRTVWDGVTNALARKYLRQAAVGDRVFFYATGKEKAIVGEMRVAKVTIDEDDPKGAVVEVEPVRALVNPVSLAAIKEEPALADWELVRLPRLSVMPVSEAQWGRVEQLSAAAGVSRDG